MAESRPTFIYDGDCGICVEWVNYWRALTGHAIAYRPYQQVAAEHPDIPPERFAKAVHLITPDRQVAARQPLDVAAPRRRRKSFARPMAGETGRSVQRKSPPSAKMSAVRA